MVGHGAHTQPLRPRVRQVVLGAEQGLRRLLLKYCTTRYTTLEDEK